MNIPVYEAVVINLYRQPCVKLKLLHREIVFEAMRECHLLVGVLSPLFAVIENAGSRME